ncbi:MAG: chemotaxis protein CheD [Candidatus Omnitrophica bacterium]|nr:chemotaxis protein CheD [Candidatus Omnitrophota bacterium]MDD5081676.1 chemotaxis protein CheD [Candidatus Omnitrophota bacterium]MDD5440650.1 chemotaxis protein CheD [Candidatus Omnitrophota bacterium]
MGSIIDVDTGEVRVISGELSLRAMAIGSCIVVIAFSYEKLVAAMAHILLPGKAPSYYKGSKIIYAHDAIEEMFNKTAARGAMADDLVVCLVGGANVLLQKDDDIAKENIISVEQILKKRRIEVRKRALGGVLRRSVFLDLAKGRLEYTEGGSETHMLWDSGMSY